MLSKIFEPTEGKRDLAFLLLRLILASVFIYHGGQKLFGWFGGHGIEGFAGYLTSLGVPFAGLNAYLAASAEFFGGLALLTGLGVQLAAMPLTITMLVAAFTAHSGSFGLANGGSEYTLVLAVASLALGLVGPGKYTVLSLLPSVSANTLKLSHDAT